MNFEEDKAFRAQLKSASILVIDDFQGMRTMLRNFVKDMGGVNIDTASTGRDAINQLRLTNYDIVICDYNLGEGPNGQHVLEEAKLHDYIGPAAVWVMVTAEKTADMVMGAAEVRPDDYVLKPVNQDLLESRLEKLIARKRSLRKVEAAIKAKNFQGAVDACNTLLGEKPANLQEILRIKTDMLLTLGKLDEAAKIFELVCAQRSIAWAKTGSAKVRFLNGDFAAAEEILREVLADNEVYMEAYDLLAKVLRAKGETQQAQDILQKATQLSPNSALRQKVLGDTAYENGDLELAQSAFERTIKISEYSPHKSAAVYTGLAKVFSAKDNPDEALKVLGKSKKEFKDSNAAALETSVAESLVYQKMGQPEKAQEAMALAQQLRKGLGSTVDSDTTLEMANAMLQMGDTAGACALLSDLVKNNHDSPALSAQVQKLFEDANLGNEGRALIQDARQHVININNQGVALGREGKLVEAIKLLHTALHELPNSETIMMNLCGLLIVQIKKSGRSESAVVELRNLLNRVQALNPSNAKLHEYSATLKGL
jgi:tetratricopeptide (TPR) repeat protein